MRSTVLNDEQRRSQDLLLLTCLLNHKTLEKKVTGFFSFDTSRGNIFLDR